MMYPLVRELATQEAPIRVPVTVTCRVLRIARAPYYRWLAAPVTEADWVAAHRANALFDAHRDDPLAAMKVSGAGFAAMTHIVRALADDLCGGRLLQLPLSKPQSRGRSP